MKFGIRLPVAGPLANPEHIASAAQHAEQLGYDSVWVHDFIGWTKKMDYSHVSCGALELITDDSPTVMYETITTLAFLAGVTENITIGSAVLCVPYRNPVVQAKQIACIDQLSGGRLVLGVGVGALQRIGDDFEIVGVPRGDKYLRTAEYLRLMRVVWDESHPSFDGDRVQLPQTEIGPKPAQERIPIWLGGKGEKSQAITAELADGWIPTWLTAPMYEESVPRLKQAVADRGRDADSFLIAKECYTAIASESNEARRFSQATFESFTKGFTVNTYEDSIASALLGSPDEILDQVAEYAAAGVEHFEMKFIYHSPEHLAEQMEMFAQTVMTPLAKETI